MKKTLLVIVSRLKQSEELDAVVQTFHERGYLIERIDDENDELDIDSLPWIIDYFKQQERHRDGLGKLVLLSNIRELLIAWYRIYHELVHDFILFFDSKDTPARPYKEMEFLQLLAGFQGAEEEFFTKKIFVHLHASMETGGGDLIRFLWEERRFRYFLPLNRFDDEQAASEPRPMNKEYKIGDTVYRFENVPGAPYISIPLRKKNASLPIRLDLAQLNEMLDYPYFLPYAAVYLLQFSGLDRSNKNRVLLTMFHLLKKADSRTKEEVAQVLLKFADRPDIRWQTRVCILSLLVSLQHRLNLLPKLLKELVQDAKHIDFHYSVLMNSLFYMSRDGQQDYPELYIDRFRIMRKLTEYYRNRLAIRPAKRVPKRIALIASQLLSTQHSPTLWVLNYAKQLRRFSPDYTIQIFVDDLFVDSPGETLLPYSYRSAVSKQMEQTHREFLAGTGIEIFYADPGKQRLERLQEEIRAIQEFSPELLLIVGNDYSLAGSLLYPEYPVLNMSLAGVSNALYADVFAAGYAADYVRRQYAKYRFDRPQPYCRFTAGIDFPKPQAEYTRSSHSITDEAFVMITVGNRLDKEMDERFIEIMGRFAKSHPDSRWLIVGLERHEGICRQYPDLVEQKRIRFIPFERELAALYRICDVFVNPFRDGGGYSGAMAMNESLPVVTLNSSLDVAGFVGAEHCASSIEEYENELDKLYRDRAYREEKGRIMKERMRMFSFDKVIEELKGLFAETVKAFHEREGRPDFIHTPSSQDACG